jgi:hypothetical protein
MRSSGFSVPALVEWDTYPALQVLLDENRRLHATRVVRRLNTMDVVG